MINATIEYSIELNAGPKKGQIVRINTNLEDLEETDLSTILIDEELLDCWCDNGEYTIKNRIITLSDQ